MRASACRCALSCGHMCVPAAATLSLSTSPLLNLKLPFWLERRGSETPASSCVPCSSRMQLQAGTVVSSSYVGLGIKAQVPVLLPSEPSSQPGHGYFSRISQKPGVPYHKVLRSAGPEGKGCMMKFAMHPAGCGNLVLSLSLSLFPCLQKQRLQCRLNYCVLCS